MSGWFQCLSFSEPERHWCAGIRSINDLDQALASPLALKLYALVGAEQDEQSQYVKFIAVGKPGNGCSGWNVIGFANEANHAAVGFNFSV